MSARKSKGIQQNTRRNDDRKNLELQTSCYSIWFRAQKAKIDFQMHGISVSFRCGLVPFMRVVLVFL